MVSGFYRIRMGGSSHISIQCQQWFSMRNVIITKFQILFFSCHTFSFRQRGDLQSASLLAHERSSLSESFLVYYKISVSALQALFIHCFFVSISSYVFMKFVTFQSQRQNFIKESLPLPFPARTENFSPPPLLLYAPGRQEPEIHQSDTAHFRSPLLFLWVPPASSVLQPIA